MIGPLPTAPGGFIRVPVAIDKFTKWIEVKPVTCPKADMVLDFLDELVHCYRLPHCIITDLGSNFNNHQLWEYCENSGINVRYISVTHPRTNRQVERANGMVLDTLKKRLQDPVNTKGGKWIKELRTLGAAYSTHQADGTVTLFPGLRLRSDSTCRHHVGVADNRAVRRRHI
jgi:hypothetical protein